MESCEHYWIKKDRLLSSPESPVDLPVTDPDVSPPSSPPLCRSSSCLGTSDLGSCEHVWAKTAGYVKGRRREMGRECVRQSTICPHVPKDLRSFPGAVKLCKVPCATCCSWVSIRDCCSGLHLCFFLGGGGYDVNWVKKIIFTPLLAPLFCITIVIHHFNASLVKLLRQCFRW